MARPSPLEIFEDNISDADRLIGLTRILLNTRTNRMRRERRDSIGEIMGISRKRRDELDCVESADVFVVLKPGGAAKRDHFTEPELRPLLRQAVVAIGAAVESYVAAKASSLVSEAFRMEPLPQRLTQLAVTFGDVLRIEQEYQRRGVAHRTLVRDHIEEAASSDPDQIGRVFSIVGRSDVMKNVDKHRGVRKGTSHQQAKALAERRNQIAHTGDRASGGRAHLDLETVEAFHRNAKEFVEALDAVI